MKKTINSIRIQDFYKTLQNLGYYNIKTEGRKSEWRKGNYHLHTYPWAKRGIKITLHKDYWKKPTPITTHKTKHTGKDIEQQLQEIQQKYKQTTQKHQKGSRPKQQL